MPTLANRPIRWLISALLLLGMSSVSFSALPARADTTAATVHKKNWIQRHPTLTAIGVGIATRHALKVAARRDKMRGKRLNWAERHPTLTAVGAGVVTHHIIKKHT